MSRMIFDLTDEDREALERVRILRGCRSHAETLRELIRSHGVDFANPLAAPFSGQGAEDAHRKPGLMAAPKPAVPYGSRLKKR